MGAALAHHQMLMAGGSGRVYDAWTVAWEAGIVAAGSSVTTTEKNWADDLAVNIRAASYASKIKAFWPFIGVTAKAHMMPLIDTATKGIASNNGFVDADCTNNGIANPTEAAKFISSLYDPSILGASGVGGMGWYERAIGFGTGTEPIGCYLSGDRWVLDLRSSLKAWRWSTVSTAAVSVASTAANKFYYGQSSATNSHELFEDGTSIGTSTTANSGAANNVAIYLMASNEGPATYWKGRGGCALMTNGQFTGAEVSALKTLLDTYLITPTGR